MVTSWSLMKDVTLNSENKTTQSAFQILSSQHMAIRGGIQRTFPLHLPLKSKHKWSTWCRKTRGSLGEAGMEGIAFLGIQGGERIITVHNPFWCQMFPQGTLDKCGPLGSFHRVKRPFWLWKIGINELKKSIVYSPSVCLLGKITF